MGLGVTRRQANRVFVGGGRRVAPADGIERAAEADMQVGVARRKRDRPAESGHRVVEPAGGGERLAQARMACRRRAIVRDGAADQVERRRMVPAAKRNGAEKVQRIGVTRFGSHEASTDRLGVVEPAGTQVRDRPRQLASIRGLPWRR